MHYVAFDSFDYGCAAWVVKMRCGDSLAGQSVVQGKQRRCILVRQLLGRGNLKSLESLHSALIRYATCDWSDLKIQQSTSKPVKNGKLSVTAQLH